MLFFPDYIETYGIGDFETAVQSFEIVTRFITCEFAVRPFIINYGSRMIAEMEDGPKHILKFDALQVKDLTPTLGVAIPALKNDLLLSCPSSKTSIMIHPRASEKCGQQSQRYLKDHPILF
jgi:hypothetical protein